MRWVPPGARGRLVLACRMDDVLGMLHRRATGEPMLCGGNGGRSSCGWRGAFSRTPAPRRTSDDLAAFMVGGFRQSQFEATALNVIVDRS
jgi:hypothetical protein